MAEEKETLKEVVENDTSINEENIEEVFAEESAENESTPSQSIEDQLKEANEKIAELESKVEEAENRYLRLQADFENSRRRARIDLETSQKYKAQSLITELLPVIDNFDRALNVEVDNEQTKALLQGMDMVYRGLLDALKKEGVEVIEAVGKEFDPNLHHAVMTTEDANFESNAVVEEFQKGYILKDRVIRPSMVKVNQ